MQFKSKIEIMEANSVNEIVNLVTINDEPILNDLQNDYDN